MRRRPWFAAIALLALAAVAPACRQAEEPPRDYEGPPSAPAAPATVVEVVVASRLNVRSGPGAEHPIVGKLDRGTQVQVLEQADGWKRVRPEHGGPEGWVAGEFLHHSSGY